MREGPSRTTTTDHVELADALRIAIARSETTEFYTEEQQDEIIDSLTHALTMVNLRTRSNSVTRQKDIEAALRLLLFVKNKADRGSIR